VLHFAVRAMALSIAAAARLPICFFAALLSAVALQGCNVIVPRHSLGNWEVQSNYLTEFQYIQAGKPKTNAVLNSCNNLAIANNLQCNGHGKCRAWNDFPRGVPVDNQVKRLSFCECDRDWADPECRTPRKSQVTAFTLSVFLGMFGVDQLYLGFIRWAAVKFLLVGVGGLWSASRILSSQDEPGWHLKLLFGLAIYMYLYDICKIGASPSLTARNFQVAADLSHFTFVLSAITLMLFLGFAAAIKSIHDDRKGKAHKLLLLRLDAQQQEEDNDHIGASWGPPPVAHQPMTNRNLAASTTFVGTGYGSVIDRHQTLPVSVRSMSPPPVSVRSMSPPPLSRATASASPMLPQIHLRGSAPSVQQLHHPPSGLVVPPTMPAARPITSAVPSDLEGRTHVATF